MLNMNLFIMFNDVLEILYVFSVSDSHRIILYKHPFVITTLDNIAALVWSTQELHL